MKLYTEQDCDQTGLAFSLKNKIVVLPKAALPDDHPGQLFFCTGGNGANPNPIGRSVFLVSLSTGEQSRFWRNDVIGTLKPEPELLSDEAKLQLSQIRPSGVWLCSPGEVRDFIEIQKPYQHRVLICDRDDFVVMEIVEGELVYPDAQALEEFQKEQKPDGGLTMT